MRLIGEQVKVLREKKAKLVEKKRKYMKYVQGREHERLENLGNMTGDFNQDMQFVRSIQDEGQIDTLLSNSEMVMKRDFDKMDIGTAAYIEFPNARRNNSRRIILTEISVPGEPLDTVSINSDFGQAVIGRTAGEEFEYKVQATGRNMIARIKSIDTNIHNYDHFLRELATTDRMCKKAAIELKRLKEVDIDEYNRRHQITESQALLAGSELNKIPDFAKDRSNVRKRDFYQRLLNGDIAELPKDNSVGVGSFVTVMLLDKERNEETRSFEMINRAVASEMADTYVERISVLGQAIYGLHEGDTFVVNRCHKSKIYGVILSVDNKKEDQFIRTK